MHIIWLFLALLVIAVITYRISKGFSVAVYCLIGILAAVVVLHTEGTLRFLPREESDSVIVGSGTFCLYAGSGYLKYDMIFDDTVTEEDVKNFAEDAGIGTVELNIKSKDKIIFSKSYGSVKTFSVEEVMSDWKTYSESGEIIKPSTRYKLLCFYF